MDVLLYFLGAVGGLVILYKMIVASNRKTMDQGRAYVASQVSDPWEFLSRPAESLRTDGEIAALNYMVLKPWKETRQHFGKLIRNSLQLNSSSTEEERRTVLAITADMGVTENFVALSALINLPEAACDTSPVAFSAWTALHKRTLEAESSKSVGYFLGISSTAAAEAILERTRTQFSRAA